MTIELYEAKLASSGLSLEDGEKLGFKHIDADAVGELGYEFDKVDSLYIPYYNPVDGTPYRFGEGTGNERDYFRIRILEDKNETKKKSIIYKAAPPDEKPPYRQPLSSPNLIYYPTTLTHTKWSDIINDVDKFIIITEGELKAAKTCKVGYPCIAVAGIYNWQNKKNGIQLIDSLKIIRFRKRTVYIAFDSDMVDKPQIRWAMIKLAEALVNIGARVLCVTVPKKLPDGKKTGLDDYFVHFEPTTNEVLQRNFNKECIDNAELLEGWKDLTQLNERYTHIHSVAAIFDKKHCKPISKNDFIDNNENKTILKRHIDKDGKETSKPAILPKEWIKWPHRASVETLVYEPGEETITMTISPSKEAVTAYNTWTGWGVDSQEGDVKPFLDLINYLCESSERGTTEWFLRWLAYPIQNPGKKLATAVVIYGSEGAGKGSLGKVFEKIYGNHFRKLDSNTFQDKYTGWGMNTSLLFADDLAAMKTKDLMSQIKLMVTESILPVREMYRETINIENHMNIIMTTNNPDALKMAADDRRFTIIQTPPYKQDSDFYYRYHAFIDREDGAEKVMNYLLNLDLTGFNPYAEALKSAAKETLKGLSASDLNRFIRDYVSSEELTCDFVSPADILVLYRRDALATSSSRSKVNTNSVTKELEACRFHKAFKGDRVRVAGTRRFFYAVRDVPKWVKASDDETLEYIREHYKPIDLTDGGNEPPLDAYDTDDF